MPKMSNHLLAGCAACGLSIVLSHITVKLCLAKGWLFHPNANRWSRRSVAKFGGVPILGSLFALSFFLHLTILIKTILFLTAGIAALGLWDDLRPIKPMSKLMAQIGIAWAAVAAGIIYPISSYHWLSFVLTAAWIVTITNGFNLLDNMDGLSAGVAAISALNLLLLVHGSNLPSALLPVFAGALIGFLFFNFSPAKIFMGDMGSLAIGFFIACMAVVDTQRISQTFSVIVAPVLLMFLPIFDTALVSVTRRLGGRAIGAGARDHSSHRLVLLGLSEKAAVITLYCLSALGGVVAYFGLQVWPQGGPGFVFLFLAASIFFWLYLAQVQLPEEWLSRTNVATLALPELLKSLSKRAGVVLTDSILLGLSLYLGFLLRFDKFTSSLSLFFSLWALSILLKIPVLALFGAYRRTHHVTSLSGLYPVAKSATFGSLALIAALTFLQPGFVIPRALLAMDFGLTFGLLSLFRVANTVFTDLLARKSDSEICILVGNSAATFYQHYFAKTQHSSLRAVATTIPGAQLRGLSVPQIPFEEIADVVDREQVSHIYVLPDCSGEFYDVLKALSETRQLRVSRLELTSSNLFERETTLGTRPETIDEQRAV